MKCAVCGGPAQIHETVIEKGSKTEKHWCLDHAPRKFLGEVEDIRAFEAWAAGWEKELADRATAGQPIPSWRVIASSAFKAGIEQGLGRPA